ncbi:MAG: CAP domain-containing protein [Hyphomicrobiaceae bacterium]
MRVPVIWLALVLASSLAGCGLGGDDEPHAKVSPIVESDPGGVPDLAAAERLIVEGTNAFRQRQGLSAVTREQRLDQVAQAFADYMARTGNYGHEADGRAPSDRALAGGYRFCMIAENIGYALRSAGFSTDGLARLFVEGWENSPPHRHNMVEPGAADIGVALAKADGEQRYFAVQLFGRPDTLKHRFQIANLSGRPLAYRIDGRAEQIGDHEAHTHTVCADVAIEVEGVAGGALRPAGGERYEIGAAAGGETIVTTRRMAGG